MELWEVLKKLRRADKVTVRDGMKTLFCGGVNQCAFEDDLISREVESFHPETLGGLVVNLKEVKRKERSV